MFSFSNHSTYRFLFLTCLFHTPFISCKAPEKQKSVVPGLAVAAIVAYAGYKAYRHVAHNYREAQQELIAYVESNNKHIEQVFIPKALGAQDNKALGICVEDFSNHLGKTRSEIKQIVEKSFILQSKGIRALSYDTSVKHVVVRELLKIKLFIENFDANDIEKSLQLLTSLNPHSKYGVINLIIDDICLMAELKDSLEAAEEKEEVQKIINQLKEIATFLQQKIDIKPSLVDSVLNLKPILFL